MILFKKNYKEWMIKKMKKIILKEKYRDLSTAELLEKVYEVAAGFEKHSQGCSQSMVATVDEFIGLNPKVIQAATSLCGGTAMQCFGTCGALAGGIISLDYFFGRSPDILSFKNTILSTQQALDHAAELPILLTEKFFTEYGGISCLQVQRKIAGSFAYSKNPIEAQEMKKGRFVQDSEFCPHVVGRAAQWLFQIMIDKDLFDNNLE